MDTGCIEVVVHRETGGALGILRVVMSALAVVSALLALIGNVIFFAVTAAALVGIFFADRNMDVDYEYDYVEKELRIALIRGKSRRKEIATYDLEELEMCAPALSHHLDGYRNRKLLHDYDYSSHRVTVPDTRYFMYLSGGTRLILNLEGEYGQMMIEQIRQFAPRKMFTE